MRTQLIAAAGILALLGCESVRDEIDTRERELLEQFRIGDPPANPSNAYADDPDAAELGYHLFFEPAFSGPLGAANGAGVPGSRGEPGTVGTIGCFACHDLVNGGADTRSRPNASSLGAGWTGRNTPTVLNAVYSPYWQFLDGRADSVWGQAAAALEAGATHNSSRLQIAHAVYDRHLDRYRAVFGDLPADLADTSSTARFPATGKPGQAQYDALPAEDKVIATRILANVGKALEAFERKLLCRNAPFDRWLDGDEEAMSASAKRGARVFLGRGGCAECHSGANFSDNQFHNTGTPQIGERASATDDGRFSAVDKVKNFPLNRASAYSDAPDDSHLVNLEARESDKGSFRTPGLRCVELTGPYKHNGVYRTLEEVVDHYDRGGTLGPFTGNADIAIQPLGLTVEERGDLVKFLQALTGEPLPDSIALPPE